MIGGVRPALGAEDDDAARRRGIREDHIRQDALAAHDGSGQMLEEDWLSPAATDQFTLFRGNTMLRRRRPDTSRGVELFGEARDQPLIGYLSAEPLFACAAQ